MNIAGFVYSEASSPLTITHGSTLSVSPSSESSKQKLANAEHIQDLRATAFIELQQSIQSYNDSFVMNMRYQEKQERLYKQQQLEHPSISRTPALNGNSFNDGFMDGAGNYDNRYFDGGGSDNSRNNNNPSSSTRCKDQRCDWNDNHCSAYHYSGNGYGDYDGDTLDDRSTIGSPLVPSRDTWMMNDLVEILQSGSISDDPLGLEWESKQKVLGSKQTPWGDLRM